MSRARHLSAAACLVAIVVLTTALAGCGSKGSGSATPVSSSSPASQSPSASATVAPPTASPTTSASPLATVPAGFKAASVTFVSLDEAFVLGTAPGHAVVLLRTLDRGQTWTRLAAPAVGLGRSQNGSATRVWGIRFATPSQGFVFGRGLWETTDGGAHWSHVTAPSGAILSLATIDGQVLALVQPGPSGPRAVLARRPLGGGSWTTVTSVKTWGSVDPTDLISTQAGTAALLSGGNVIVTQNGGLTVHTYPLPSTSMLGPSAVAVTSTGSLAVLDAGNGAAGSMQKLVYTSADGGATWTKAGAPSREGDPVTIAGGSPATLLVGGASGASFIFGSTDGGHAWKTVLVYGDGGVGWADLGFSSPTHVIVIHGPADTSGNTDGRPGQLLLSSNGGATWQAVTF